jgi:hypothetical protein
MNFRNSPPHFLACPSIAPPHPIDSKPDTARIPEIGDIEPVLFPLSTLDCWRFSHPPLASMGESPFSVCFFAKIRAIRPKNATTASCPTPPLGPARRPLPSLTCHLKSVICRPCTAFFVPD